MWFSFTFTSRFPCNAISIKNILWEIQSLLAEGPHDPGWDDVEKPFWKKKENVKIVWLNLNFLLFLIVLLGTIKIKQKPF